MITLYSEVPYIETNRIFLCCTVWIDGMIDSPESQLFNAKKRYTCKYDCSGTKLLLTVVLTRDCDRKFKFFRTILSFPDDLIRRIPIIMNWHSFKYCIDFFVWYLPPYRILYIEKS